MTEELERRIEELEKDKRELKRQINRNYDMINDINKRIRNYVNGQGKSALR